VTNLKLAFPVEGMPGELESFKKAVGDAEQLWRDLSRGGEATYVDVVYALSVAETRQHDASEKRGSYSTDKKGELDRLSNILRDMRGVIVKPNMKRGTQPYPGPVNIV